MPTQIKPTDWIEESEQIAFEQLFNLNDIQLLQDEFSKATGVASIITHPDGTPITAPSLFTRFCKDIVRQTDKGCANCYRSDSLIGSYSLHGPTIQPCMSGGLWDAGAGISVGGHHIANWLIGQVRDETQSEEKIRFYAREIGANEEETLKAFHEVPSMSIEKFSSIAHMLFTLANQLSEIAYQNLRQKRLIEHLKAAESNLQLAANVFIHAREGIMITDAKGTIVDVNQTFSQITGFSREEVMGNTPRLLRSGTHDARFYASLWQSLIQSGNWSGEIWNRRKNGEIYVAWLTVSAVRDNDANTQNFVALFTDITQLKRHERQLQHLAHYDSLTGLPNRTLFAERLNQAMATCKRYSKSLAVVYLDLDGFKPINDKHGHAIGDQLLIAVAQAMKSIMREGDTLARIGGDEFTAVLVNLEDAADCLPVLTRLLHAATTPVTVRGLALQSSASIGYTLFPQDFSDADQLLRHADQAMYHAKQAGKNRFYKFDVELAAMEKSRLQNVARIRLALAQHELVLHYQPVVNLRTGQVVGAEALIRWLHPEQGLLPPAAFLPQIENLDVSVNIGEWVIDTCMRQISAWRSLELNLPVSINIGACQLQQKDFAQRLSAILGAHPNVPPQLIQLEITESSALEQMAHVLEVMHECQRRGVSFALDDFGTGYSSLIYLKRFPFDVLKIDQSFIRNILDNTEDQTIVKGVIGLANAFKRTVIAEGVESSAQADLLLSLGCELAQGYGSAPPMPGELIPSWIESWTASQLPHDGAQPVETITSLRSSTYH